MLNLEIKETSTVHFHVQNHVLNISNPAKLLVVLKAKWAETM